MSIERISLERYLDLLGDHHLDHSDLGHAWFASNDSCIIGRVSLCPASHLWDAIALAATSGGWAETEVDPGEFTTLRSAESALVIFMADLVTDGVDCRKPSKVNAVHDIAHY